MRITYGARTDVAVGALYDLTFTQFAEWLATHPRPQSEISLAEYPTLAAAPSASPMGQRLAAAKAGPWICFAEFDGNRRHLRTTPRGCAVALDLDYAGVTLEQIARTLYGYSYAAHTTFGHTSVAPRWRVIVPTSGVMDAATHRATWAALNALFGNTADVSAKDISRLNYLPGACIAPHEAATYYDLNGVLFSVVPAPPDAAPTATSGEGPVEGWRGPLDDDELLRKAFAIILRPEERFGSGKSLLQALFEPDGDMLSTRFPSKDASQGWDYTRADLALANELLYFTGRDVERSKRLAMRAGCVIARNEPEEAERKLVYAFQVAGRGEPRFYEWHAPIVIAPSATPEQVDTVTAMGTLELTRKPNGQFAPTLLNITQVLALPQLPRLASDTFRGEVMIAPVGTEEWRPVDDVITTRIMMDFERLGFAPIAVEIMRRAIDEVGHRQQFDSAIRWLDALVWDGVPRIETFFPIYAQTDDDAYTRAVSLYLWTALAGRALQPGIKADMVPVLIGAQGKGKTWSLQALVPHPDHYVEVSLMDRDTDVARLMRGKLVGEIGELRGLAKRDLESVKSFMSRQHEQWIPKYREFAITFPRRLVFIGTTNQSQFLEDDTGNRRWLPLTVRLFDRDSIIRDREQLWAEAAHVFRRSGIAWQNAEALAGDRHGAHMVTDSWEACTAVWIDETPTPIPGDTVIPIAPSARDFHISEVLRGALKLTPDRMNRSAEQRVSRILRGMGYESSAKRSGGRVVQMWRKR